MDYIQLECDSKKSCSSQGEEKKGTGLIYKRFKMNVKFNASPKSANKAAA